VVFVTPPGKSAIAAHVTTGVHTLISAEASKDELFAALQSLDSGVPYVAPHLIRALAEDGSIEPSAQIRLTPREVEVVRELIEGNSNREIAVNLCLSPNTVRSHLQTISAKLGVKSRARLAARARMLNLVDALG
jgi:DNA-binding NarL/FixJ family response regulator